MGSWRAVLDSPGGELPFGLEITAADSKLAGVVINGEERLDLSEVSQQGTAVRLAFSWYDSQIAAELDAAGEAMTGTWTKRVEKGEARLPFRASRGVAQRFQPAAALGLATDPTAPPTVAGTWAVEFTDEDGSEAAQAELSGEGDAVRGTFLTPTGDYRFLAGSYEGGLLRLSAFDGAHAFLFSARAKDGALAGDFWSRDTYHATWAGRPTTAGESVLPDAWSMVQLQAGDGRLPFDETTLDGQPLRSTDPRFAGKVVVINLFGSWCPNCNDEAPMLADWYRRYHDQGLEIVGFAYEMTGDRQRDAAMVERYRQHHQIPYQLSLVGVSNKQQAASTLPELSAVKAFPTTIFVGRDGKVAKIHTGFAGPGTGEHFQALKQELEGVLEGLLAAH